MTSEIYCYTGHMTKPLSGRQPVRVGLYKDEYWPFYGLEDNHVRTIGCWSCHGHKDITLPVVFVRRYERAMKEFKAVQELLRQLEKGEIDTSDLDLLRTH